MTPDSILEYRVQNVKHNRSLKSLCEDIIIMTRVNEGIINGLAIDIFNDCMSLKTTGLGFWQLQVNVDNCY